MAVDRSWSVLLRDAKSSLRGVSDARGTTVLSAGGSTTTGVGTGAGAAGASTFFALGVLGVLGAADILYIIKRVLFIFIFGLI
jgi:hypothetical protein